MKKNETLESIQKYLFYALDLNLYLDNFPENKEAREDYKIISCKLMMLVKEYEKDNGPLMNFGMTHGKKQEKWTDSRWPWEKGEER